jgi:hypothetical protein
MSLKSSQISRFPSQRDGHTQYPSLEAGASGIDIVPMQVVKARVKLEDIELTVAASDDFGSVKLCTLPDTNLYIMGMEVNLAVVKAGTTNGIVAATDLDFGIGSAAASASTLATTMIDYLEKSDVNDDALAVSYQAHTQGQSTASFPKKVADAADNELYLNLACAITADDSVTLNGWVDIFYVDLGNEIS